MTPLHDLLDSLRAGPATLRWLADETGRTTNVLDDTARRAHRRALVTRVKTREGYVYTLAPGGFGWLAGREGHRSLAVRAAEASAAIDTGTELPWDLARRLGFRSADRMVDAVLAYRRTSPEGRGGHPRGGDPRLSGDNGRAA